MIFQLLSWSSVLVLCGAWKAGQKAYPDQFNTEQCMGVDKQVFESHSCKVMEPAAAIDEKAEEVNDDFTSRGLWTIQHYVPSGLVDLRQLICESSSLMEHGCGCGRAMLEARAVNPNLKKLEGINKRGYGWVQVNGEPADAPLWNKVARQYSIPLYQCSPGIPLFPSVSLVDSVVIEDYPYEANSFDLIYSQNALDTGKLNANESHIWAHKMLRVLEPGGVLVVGLTNKLITKYRGLESSPMDSKSSSNMGGVPRDESDDGIEVIRYSRFRYTHNHEKYKVEMMLIVNEGEVYVIALKGSFKSLIASKEGSDSLLTLRPSLHNIKHYMDRYNLYSLHGSVDVAHTPHRHKSPIELFLRSKLALKQEQETEVSKKDAAAFKKGVYSRKYLLNLFNHLDQWEQYGLS